jgi:hypothetical protein
MKTLPRDLTQTDSTTLREARKDCDDRLTELFRRWPRLGRKEMRELQALYAERLRIAKHIGSLRRRGRKRPLAGVTKSDALK